MRDMLICTSEYPPTNSSGIGNAVFNLKNTLDRMGLQCDVCSPNGPDIVLGNPSLISSTGIVGLLDYWLRVHHLLTKNSENYRALWLHNPLLFSVPRDIGILATIHSTYHGEFKRGSRPIVYKLICSVIEKIAMRSIRCESRFSAVSSEVASELGEIGIDRNRIQVIANGVNTDVFRPVSDKTHLRSQLGIPSDSMVFASVGRLDYPKLPIELIKLFSRIHRNIPTAVLVVAGDGRLMPKVRKETSSWSKDCVAVLGKVDYGNDVPRILAAADYFILASRYEGNPLSLLEALSSGLPCIVSKIPNLRFVEELGLGIAVDFENIDEEENSVLKFIREGRSPTMPNSAREYVVRNHDWRVIVGKFIELLDSLPQCPCPNGAQDTYAEELGVGR